MVELVATAMRERKRRTALPHGRQHARQVGELAMLTWGMPSPPAYVKGADRGITNIRNTNSKHWRRWLGVENRCVVMATSFSEPSPTKDENGKTPTVWFALNEDRPLFAFAGIWTP